MRKFLFIPIVVKSLLFLLPKMCMCGMHEDNLNLPQGVNILSGLFSDSLTISLDRYNRAFQNPPTRNIHFDPLKNLKSVGN